MTNVDDAMHIHSGILQKEIELHCITYVIVRPIIYSFRFIARQKKHKTCRAVQVNKWHFCHSLVRTSRNLAIAFFNDVLRLNTHTRSNGHRASFQAIRFKVNAFYSIFIDLNILNCGQVQHVAQNETISDTRIQC